MKYCPVCNDLYDDSMSFCTRDGEVLQEDPGSLVGTTLDGQYAIEALLGKGGMGAVYRARHILLGDRVAVKFLPPQMRGNTEWLKRFQREGQAARRFRHPNAVTVYDLRTTSDGLVYMVMEYVEGRTLDQELSTRGQFSPHDALSVLEPVMNALNAAHAVGVVHRDIKPENIMIGRAQTGGETTIKILDMGIAKLAAGDETTGTGALTMAGQILGTPHYMSPEQWGEIPRDNGHEIDGRADIYSVGAVIYQLVSGKRPFFGTTLPEIRRQHVSVTPQPLNEIVSNVPATFSNAVMRALSKDRNDRQATAAELVQELRASLGLSQSENLSAFIPIEAKTEAHSSPTANQQKGAETNLSAGLSRTNAPTEVISSNTGFNTGSIQNNTIANVPPAPQSGQKPLPPTTVNPPIAPPSQPLATQQHASFQHASTQDLPPASQQNIPFQHAATQDLPPTSMANIESLGVSFNQSTPSVNVAPPVAHTAPLVQPVAPKKSSNKALLLIPVLGVGLLVVIAVLGVGGYIFRDKIFPTTDPSPTPNPSPSVSNSPNPQTSPQIPIVGQEEMRYWFDVLKTDSGGNTERVAQDPAILKSGQSFKFNFVPQSDGYLYIIGTGQNNAPTTFLTDRPVKESGVNTNKLAKGERYMFPSGDKNWITLDNVVGLEKYTLIFSQTSISSPAFFAASAGKLLSEGEKKELDDFLEKYKANRTELSVKGAGTNESFVSVKASFKDQPIIFVITVDHK